MLSHPPPKMAISKRYARRFVVVRTPTGAISSADRADRLHCCRQLPAEILRSYVL
jgi:hypothetical protein